eukprot:scaffold56065_cov16-Tisochrysis_lutea.AAC.4
MAALVLFCQVLGFAFGLGRVVGAERLHEILAFQHAHPTILIPYRQVQLAIPGRLKKASCDRPPRNGQGCSDAVTAASLLLTGDRHDEGCCELHHISLTNKSS